MLVEFGHTVDSERPCYSEVVAGAGKGWKRFSLFGLSFLLLTIVGAGWSLRNADVGLSSMYVLGEQHFRLADKGGTCPRTCT